MNTRNKIGRYIGLSVFLFAGFLMARGIVWQGNQTLHTLMEVVAALLSLMVGILALIQFYTKKTNTFLFIAMGFLGSAFLDGYHAIATSAFVEMSSASLPSSLISWRWIAAPVLLSLVMAFGGWAPVYGTKNKKDRLPKSIVYTGIGVCALAGFLLLASLLLPRADASDAFFGRPEAFVPAGLFLIALVGYLKKGGWKEDSFEDWVVLSLIVGLIGQALFMRFSFALFDMMFVTAHLLKTVSFLCMMQGLLSAMIQRFRKAELRQADLERALEETQTANLQAWKEKEAAEKKRRLELEQMLKEVEISKKEFESVVEFSPNGIVLTDDDRKMILVNSMTETLFGYPRSELIGKPVEILIPLRYKETHAAHVSHYYHKPVSKMGTSRKGSHLLGMRKDGTEFPVEISLSPIQTKQGTRVLAVIHDISERRAAEEKLEEQRRNLAKANLELDQFVYTASHDLRTPLRGINSFSRFIEEDYADKLDDEGKDYLRRIRKGVDRMTQLIDDLLSLSRVSKQKNPYEEIKVADLIRLAIERIEFDIEESRVDLVIQNPMPVIYCDRIKITGVFFNLISNAIKFSQKNNNGGPKVEVGYREQDEDHQFFVKDNGIGIDPKYHDKIFEIFQRLHSREEYEGTGAGLSIVKRIIDDHKGRVWIDSELEKGTTFYFTIPKKIDEE